MSRPQSFSDAFTPTANHFQMRPASEIVNPVGRSVEADKIDKWFEDLNYYESTLESMAKAKLDVNFKDELSAIEQWFLVLSEGERTTALYSLLQHVNPIQIRFFTTVLNQKGSLERGSSVDYQRQSVDNSKHHRESLKSNLGPVGSARSSHPPGIPQSIANSDGFLPSSPAQIVSHPFKQTQTSIQAGLLRPRTPVEEAIAAANWCAQQKIAPMSPNKSQVNEVRKSSISMQGSQSEQWCEGEEVYLKSKISYSPSIDMVYGATKAGMVTSLPRSQSPDPYKNLPAEPQRVSTPQKPFRFNSVVSSPNPSEWSENGDYDEGRVNRFSTGSRRSSSASPSHVFQKTLSVREKGKIPDEIDLNLLKDIPAWLRSLRLHKYTALFENMNYKEMIVMDDAQLEAIGVAALGARRKLVKVFEMVRSSNVAQ